MDTSQEVGRGGGKTLPSTLFPPSFPISEVLQAPGTNSNSMQTYLYAGTSYYKYPSTVPMTKKYQWQQNCERSLQLWKCIWRAFGDMAFRGNANK